MIEVDELIVGAGPAGLQMAHFLAHDGASFAVLEAGDGVATFFRRYPPGGSLISVNKVRTGSDDVEFNLRHDWNSLLDLSVLEDGMAPDEGVWMRHFSDAYFPTREDMVRYLEAFAASQLAYPGFEGSIRFGQRVVRVQAVDAGGFDVTAVDAGGHFTTYRARKRLWWAAGLVPEERPDNLVSGAEHLTQYVEVQDVLADPARRAAWTNREVMVWGNGNSAFEVANLLTPICSRVHLFGTNGGHKWATSTHYPGDLRGVYAPFMDTFLLKSMNSINCLPRNWRFKIGLAPPLPASSLEGPTPPDLCLTYAGGSVILERLAGVVNATGFRVDQSPFHDAQGPTPMGRKYWCVHGDFEVVGVPGMFVLGALQHVLDRRRSGGAFVHGFRYLVRWAFESQVRRRFRERANMSLEEATRALYERWQRASAPYQMFGVMGDLLWRSVDGTWTLVEDVHLPTLLSGGARCPFTDRWNADVAPGPGGGPPLWDETQLTPPHLPVFMATLEHGYQAVTDTESLGWNESPNGVATPGNASRSSLLHPVVRVFSWPWPTVASDENVPPPGIDYMALTTHQHLLEETHFVENLEARFEGANQYHERLLRTLAHPWRKKVFPDKPLG